MRRRNWVGAALLVVSMAGIAAMGCAAPDRLGNGSVSGGDSRFAATLRDVGGAPATGPVAESLRPFFVAGLGFILLGGLGVVAGMRSEGVSLMVLGIAATATGVLFTQYPWTVLVFALAAGIALALALYDRRKARRELAINREVLEATAEVIQNIPEGGAVKAGLSGMGTGMKTRIRSVIDPIKDKLRREGRID